MINDYVLTTYQSVLSQSIAHVTAGVTHVQALSGTDWTGGSRSSAATFVSTAPGSDPARHIQR